MSACEQFRAFLERMIEENYGEREGLVWGEALRNFDEVHQHCRENTGEQCSSENQEEDKQCR